MLCRILKRISFLQRVASPITASQPEDQDIPLGLAPLLDLSSWGAPTGIALVLLGALKLLQQIWFILKL
jgi:hypothetical protein